MKRKCAICYYSTHFISEAHEIQPDKIYSTLLCWETSSTHQSSTVYHQNWTQKKDITTAYVWYATKKKNRGVSNPLPLLHRAKLCMTLYAKESWHICLVCHTLCPCVHRINCCSSPTLTWAKLPSALLSLARSETQCRYASTRGHNSPS